MNHEVFGDTAEICKKAGLTYNGMTIGLPDEYYAKEERKARIFTKLKSLIVVGMTEIQNDREASALMQELDLRITEKLKKTERL